MHWKTTLAGVLAAIGQALSAIGALPPPWGTVAGLLSALGIALLGATAGDASKVKPAVPKLP